MIVEPLESTHDDENGQTTSPRHLYLEFGAGKGLLGLAVHVSDPKAFLVFIERSSNRKKVDKILNDNKFHNFERVRMDIRHCLVKNLTCLQHNPHTASTIVAKHLCGLASDLAIRSLSHVPSSDRKRGLGIATCCHHACNFDDYVGHRWLSERSISRSEFNILKQWSAWATLDRVADYRKPKQESTEQQVQHDKVNGEEEEEDHAAPVVSDSIRPVGLTAEQMLDIGKKTKRFLDFGRVRYMREELGMSAELVYYCDSKLSPECVMIVAKDT
jgi:tRNA:m4X modification enzyme